MGKESEIVPKKRNIRELLSNSYFRIPLFQRSYSWSLEHWQDFWNDLTIHMDKGHDFFLGSVVLKDTKKDAVFEIIDGQQRITTCIILLSAIREFLKENQNKDSEKIHRYIEYDDYGRKEQPRLKLNKYDNAFFQNNITGFNSKIKEVKNRGLDEGERNILKAYKFFYENLKSYSSKIDILSKNLLDNTYVITIQVEDDVQAYTVFETLNSRGKDLTAADLIKNSVLARASNDEVLGEVSESWDRITQNLSNYSITLFIKYYLTALQGEPIREKELFKKIKSSGVIDSDVEKFVKELEKASEVYLNLLEPKRSFWEDKEIPEILSNIKLMGLKTCYPLLLIVSLNQFKTSVKKEIFSEVEKLGFRYSIILNNNPNQMEVKYADWAGKMKANQLQIQDLKRVINKIKPKDEDFYNEFLEKTIMDNKLSHYILRKIGKSIHGNELLTIDENASVEHIIPKKSDKWKSYIEGKNELKLNGEDVSLNDFIEQITSRIGNQTLLLADDNSKLGNEPFDNKKKEVYSKSKFQLNKDISQENEWTLKEIEKYQKKMADLAKEIW